MILQVASCECISGSRWPKCSTSIATLRLFGCRPEAVVWRLGRLGRSLRHLIDVIADLEKRGIGFRSLQESIDTITSGGRLIFHIFGALVEFERNLIRERTQAGLKAARVRGRLGGRPKALDAKKTELAYQLYDAKEHTIKEICQMLGIS